MYIFSAKWDWQERTREAHGRRTCTTSLWVWLVLSSTWRFKNSSELLGANGVSRYCTSRFCLSPLLLWLESLLWRRRKSSPESGKSKKVCIQRPLTKIQGGATFHMRDIRRNVLPKFIGALYGDTLLLHCSDLTELYGWVGYSPNYNFAGIFFAFSKVLLVFGLKVKFDRLC